MSNADTGPPPDGDLNTTNPRTDDEFDIDALLADAERDLKAERVPTGTMPPVQPLDTSSSVPDITASPPAQDMQAIIQGVTEYLQRNLPATMLPPSARAMVAPPVPMPPVQPMDDAPSTPASDQRTNGPRTSIDLPGGLGQIHLANISPENAEMVRSAVANLNLWGGSPPVSIKFSIGGRRECACAFLCGCYR